METRNVNRHPKTTDLVVFVRTVQAQGFAKAAIQMGVSPAYISKRIGILEHILSCKLLHRSARSVSLTEKGMQTYEWSLRILNEMEGLIESVTSEGGYPSGLLRISSSVGFGRNHVAPLLIEFAALYPHLDIRFDTIDEFPNLTDRDFDLDIRIGNNIAEHLISKRLLTNRRVLCASPAYLTERGTPESLEDLAVHNCLMIKERGHSFGVWQFDHEHGRREVRVYGSMASNNGEIVCDWARAGCGIVLRSQWDVAQDVQSGRLVHILQEYWQNADVWAVFPFALHHSPKLKLCVAFLEERLRQAVSGNLSANMD